MIQQQSTPTDRFSGADFQRVIDQRLDTLRDLRQASIGHYGLKVRYDSEVNAYRPIRSLPDYEGIWGQTGRQTIFECVAPRPRRRTEDRVATVAPPPLSPSPSPRCAGRGEFLASSD